MDKYEFQEKAKQIIDKAIAKIEELEAQKEQATVATKAMLEEQIAELKERKNRLKARYEDLRNATDDKFEETKAAFSSAADSFEEGFAKITAIMN